MSRLRLIQTCGACPEQYDVYDGEEKVGYMRLRHGYFYVQYPSSGGTVVYTANPRGDGSFADERERKLHLRMGCRAIIEQMMRNKDEDDLYTIEPG